MDGQAEQALDHRGRCVWGGRVFGSITSQAHRQINAKEDEAGALELQATLGYI